MYICTYLSSKITIQAFIHTHITSHLLYKWESVVNNLLRVNCLTVFVLDTIKLLYIIIFFCVFVGFVFLFSLFEGTFFSLNTQLFNQSLVCQHIIIVYLYTFSAILSIANNNNIPALSMSSPLTGCGPISHRFNGSFPRRSHCNT